jgi:hypothetical protein
MFDVFAIASVSVLAQFKKRACLAAGILSKRPNLVSSKRLTFVSSSGTLPELLTVAICLQSILQGALFSPNTTPLTESAPAVCVTSRAKSCLSLMTHLTTRKLHSFQLCRSLQRVGTISTLARYLTAIRLIGDAFASVSFETDFLASPLRLCGN